MSAPVCKATGLPIAGWGAYVQRAVEYRATRRDQEPNGDAHTWMEDAGVFCSDACLAAYLEEWDPPHQPTRPPQSVLRQRGLPCVRRHEPARWPGADTEEPF